VVRWVLASDIGQARDYTAVAVIEAVPDALHLKHLGRAPLGTDYGRIADDIGKLYDALPDPKELVIDGTGVGRPVVDLLRKPGHRAVVPASITNGYRVRKDEAGFWRVPKRPLVTALTTAIETNYMKIAKDLPCLNIFERELKAYQAKISATGHTSYDGGSEHDDTVIAVALGVWRLRATAGHSGTQGQGRDAA